MKPVFVINFKAYDQAAGEACLHLAKELDEVARIKGVRVILGIPATELRTVATAVSHAEVYAQHVDAIEPGAHTGWMTPAMILATGVKGVILNHSERRVDDVATHVEAAIKAGLKVVLCAQDAQEVKIFRNYPVEFLAIEPPELIGGNISVATAKPELISASVKHCSDRLLVGAGVKNHADVAKSMEMGAKGVILASGVVKNAKPREALLEMCSGW